MLRYVLVLSLSLQFFPLSFAARHTTIEQLKKELVSNHGKRDNQFAGRLLTFELSERLNAEQLSAMQASLPGPDSRQALQIISDIAEFQDPPATEILSKPTPSLEQQRDIAARAIEGVMATIHRLPSLFVTRNSSRFEDTPADLQTTNTESQSGLFKPSQPLHLASKTTENVAYRYGDEFILSAGGERAASTNSTLGLSVFGQFGQLLSTVFTDLNKGKLEWGHWEQGTSNDIAVFRYSVPREASHYQLQFCCIDGDQVEKSAAYHGSISIDPADGSILRLILITDPVQNDPVSKASVMIQYSTVVLGNQSFSCPVRSVALSVSPAQFNHPRVLPAIGSSVSNGNVVMVDRDRPGTEPPQIMLNESVYEHYSLTRPN